MSELTIICLGVAAGQGSKRHIGNGVMIESSKRTRPWREAVKQVALDVMEYHDRLEGPVRVDLVFTFDRPAGHWRSGRNAHLIREHAPARPSTRSSGDIDKLARACLDAITDAGVIKDDAQVCVLRAAKHWCSLASEPPWLHNLGIPGVRITVRTVDT